MSDKTTKKVMLLLSKEEHYSLKRLALETDMSIQEICKKALHDHFLKYKNKGFDLRLE